MVCLFAILFSFSVSAYNSLQQLPGEHDFNFDRTHVDTSSNSLTTDNLLFEDLENENDSEDFSSEAFLLLPFYHKAFKPVIVQTSFSNSISAEKAPEPIFISIRVLRI